MTHETQKNPENTGKHLAEPVVGGEFNDYDPKGQLSRGIRYAMGNMIDSTRSLKRNVREPSEIARIEAASGVHSEHEMAFLDKFAHHIVRGAIKLPLHRHGDDAILEARKPKHDGHGSHELIAPL